MLFNFIKLEITLPLTVNLDQNAIRKLSWITHRPFLQSPVHCFYLEAALSSLPRTNKEQMGDNPLDIPFQMSRDLTTYHK